MGKTKNWTPLSDQNRALLDANMQLLFAAFYSLATAGEKADDDFQQACYYDIARRFEKFEPNRSKISTYIYLSMKWCIYRVRTRRKRAWLKTPVTCEDNVVVGVSDQIPGWIDQEATAAALTRLLAREREMVLGYYWEGKTLDEIGTEHGITRERVRQILGGALKKLGRILEK